LPTQTQQQHQDDVVAGVFSTPSTTYNKQAQAHVLNATAGSTPLLSAAVTEVELCYLLDDSVFSHLFCCCRRHADPKPFMDIIK
jgi:hypothetical protein